MQAEHPTTPARTRSPNRQIWSVTACLALLALVAVALMPADGPFVSERWTDLAFFGLLALFALAEVFSVHLHFTKNSHSVSLFEIPLTLGLFFAPSRTLIAAHLVGAFLALALHRRQPPRKLAFNLAMLALGDALAVIVFRGMTDDGAGFTVRAMLASGAGVLTASMVSALSVVFVVSLSEGSWLGSRLVTSVTFNSAEAIVSTSLALTAVAVITAYPEASWLLLIPTIGLYLTNHAYARERRRHQGIEFLHDSTRLLHQSPELEAALVQLVDQARQAYRAGFAELVYLPAEGDHALAVVADTEEVRSRSGSFDELGVQELRDFADRASSPLLVQRGNDHDALSDYLGRNGLVDAIVAPLRAEGRQSGVLLIGNRPGDVARFDRADVALWETLAVNVAAALENGHLEQSLGRLQQLEERLVYEATHDPLTLLPNRSLLIERVDEALAAGPQFALLFIDLDDFKTVNDSLGHAAGDEMLRVVADRLNARLPSKGVAARLGGDEFAVLLPAIDDEATAVIVAQRLLSSVSNPIPIAGRAIPVRASIGVALSDSGWGTSDVLRNADVAMYSAKTQGKNRIAVFEPSLHEEAVRRYQLSVDLDRAIREGELRVHFQPIIELGTECIVGAEALVRWEHPTQGLLPAAMFIDAAEESDAVIAIRRIVLEHVCEFVARMAADDSVEGVPIWVNLSTRDLLHATLASELATVLAQHEVDATQLVIEVTEGLMIADRDAASRALSGIKTLGARIALDDFGTGYSSLSTLHQLPVDILKIAKPFVDDVDAAHATTAFVESIIRMGQALGLAIVAEGIERPAQSELLTRLGCTMGQGFLFGRALPPERLLDVLRRSLVVADLVALTAPDLQSD